MPDFETPIIESTPDVIVDSILTVERTCTPDEVEAEWKRLGLGSLELLCRLQYHWLGKASHRDLVRLQFKIRNGETKLFKTCGPDRKVSLA